MTFALPSYPGFVDASPVLYSNNAEPEPILGGEIQRFNRLGSKFGLRVTLPPMEYADARLWIAALLRAENERATFEWPQPGFEPDDIGVTTVGAVSSANATVLAVAGLTGGKAILAGRFFNHVKGGVRRLHACLQTGTTPIVIGPRLRAPAAIGETLDFVTPLIEGLVKGPDIPWDVNAAHHYGLTFEIRETK